VGLPPEDVLPKAHPLDFSARKVPAVAETLPPLKPGKDEAFRAWFAWSNEAYARHEGFISRRLLVPQEGGNYAAIVEHESYESFMAMHTSPTQAEVNERITPLLAGRPSPEFYETVELAEAAVESVGK
jgi:antibiotic biosynthesis monooxygenase (ABM) superfamily enzyme